MNNNESIKTNFHIHSITQQESKRRVNKQTTTNRLIKQTNQTIKQSRAKKIIRFQTPVSQICRQKQTPATMM